MGTVGEIVAIKAVLELAFFTKGGSVEEVILGFVALETTSKALAVETYVDLAMLAFSCAIVLVEISIFITLFTFIQTQTLQTIFYHTELADS